MWVRLWCACVVCVARVCGMCVVRVRRMCGVRERICKVKLCHLIDCILAQTSFFVFGANKKDTH